MEYSDNDKQGVAREEKLKELAFTREVMWEGKEKVPLEQLVAYLNHCRYEVGLLHEGVEDYTRRMGKVLVSVKKQLKKRGEFIKWVTDNLSIPPRTAQNAMTYYRVTLDHPGLMGLKKSVIYILGAKCFTKKFLQELEDTDVGCFNIKHKDVVSLKVAIENGDVAPDSIVIDQYFKKIKEVSISKQLKAADKRVISSLERKRKDFDKFIHKQREVAGPNSGNRFTEHGKFMMKVLNNAIDMIKSGPEKVQNTSVSKAQRPVSSIAVTTHTDAKKPEKKASVLKKLPKKNSRDVINDLAIAPYEIVCGDNNVPDDALIKNSSLSLLDIKPDSWVDGDYCITDEQLLAIPGIVKEDMQKNITDEKFCPFEEEKYLEEIICPDDFLYHVKEVGNG